MLSNQSAVLGAIAAVFFIIYLAHVLRKRARLQDTCSFADRCAADVAVWQSQEKCRAQQYWSCTLREAIRENARIGLTRSTIELKSGVFCDTLCAILRDNGFVVHTCKKHPAGIGADDVINCDIFWNTLRADIPREPTQRQH